MKKRILAALLAASMALCAGCGSQSDDTAEDDQTPSGTAVEVTEVTQGAMSTEYSVNGKVAADNEVQVFPMLAGQVLTLSVSEGDRVSKGQTLLSVDTSTVTSTMSSLRESYNATKTATDKAIENAQISVQQAQLAVENTEALLEAGAAAEQDLMTTWRPTFGWAGRPPVKTALLPRRCCTTPTTATRPPTATGCGS